MTLHTRQVLIMYVVLKQPSRIDRVKNEEILYSQKKKEIS